MKQKENNEEFVSNQRILNSHVEQVNDCFKEYIEFKVRQTLSTYKDEPSKAKKEAKEYRELFSKFSFSNKVNSIARELQQRLG